MTRSNEFVDHLLELMQQAGIGSEHLHARSMFGGHGIFHDGLMFALVADDELYLKLGDNNRSEFEQAGLPRFGYQRRGKRLEMSYALAPGEIFDDPEVMAHWTNAAIDASRAAKHGRAT